MSIVVLGPQASPPARVPRNPDWNVTVRSHPWCYSIGSFQRGQAGTPAVPGQRCSYYSAFAEDFRFLCTV